jgi:hypothetical protein
MSAPELPDDIRRLIAESIDSIPELEAILLLREYRTRTWTAVQAGERLYVSKTVAAHILAVLETRGFLTADEQGYRYSPSSKELEATLDRLAAAYSHHLVPVTQLVHAKPNASVRHFADAFRFRKEK